MIAKYSAVIFDLDGTILDTLEDLHSALNYALLLNGFDARTLEEVRHFVGNGSKKLIERAIPYKNDATKQKVRKDFATYYENHCLEKTKPYNAISEMLSLIKKSKIKTAVVSNKDNDAVQRLVQTFFPNLFDVAVGAKDGILCKPAPDAVFAAIKYLDVDKKFCVYVGDSEVDIETAHNASLPCISVSWGFKERSFLQEHGAKIIVDNTEQLMQQIFVANKK